MRMVVETVFSLQLFLLIHSTIDTNNDVNSIKKETFLTTMQKSVNKWKSDINGPNYLARELDFLYTDANLSFQNLKGKDNPQCTS